MKNRDEKMRLRYQEKEDTRRLKVIDKQMRREKEAAYTRTDKDMQEAEAVQRLFEIAARSNANNAIELAAELEG